MNRGYLLDGSFGPTVFRRSISNTRKKKKTQIRYRIVEAFFSGKIFFLPFSLSTCSVSFPGDAGRLCSRTGCPVPKVLALYFNLRLDFLSCWVTSHARLVPTNFIKIVSFTIHFAVHYTEEYLQD